MPRSEAKKKEYNDTRKKKRHADKAKAEADAAAARVPSEGPSGDSDGDGDTWRDRYEGAMKQIDEMFEHYDTWREKYEVSAIREGQLTAELGQKERELEDLRREFKLWIREWKDEKAELEREHKREIARWRQANITLALLRGIPVGEWEGTKLTDPNGESPTSSPLRKKNGHGGDRVSAKWKAKKAAEVLALSSCSPKRKKKK